MEPELEFPQEQSFTQKRGRGNYTPGITSSPIPSKNRKYEVSHLWERHHMMKRLCIAGASHTDIAEACGVTKATVSNILNSSIMRREIELARGALDKQAGDIAMEIKRLHPKAMQVLESILDDLNAPIALKAKVAMDNLSRGGYSPVVRGSLDITHSFSREELEAIKQDAVAAGIRVGNIVDAEYTERSNDE